MATSTLKDLSSDRIYGPSSANAELLDCSICHSLLWKPVACQTCETPFCSTCINQWLTSHPNQCPNRCEIFTERKCPPFIAKLLAQLQIRCSYQEHGCEEVITTELYLPIRDFRIISQTIPYEALEKHEMECGYQTQQCSGCQSKMLKKDLAEHKNECPLIELTCEDCQLMYRRNETTTKHAENICLREQLRQLRDESIKNKLHMQELSRQLREMRSLNPMSTRMMLSFADLPSAEEKSLTIPNKYKGLKWTSFAYMHRSFATNKHPQSGYAAAFTSAGSLHIAYFKDQASISAEHPNKTFTLISLNACASWKDDLQLTIKGYQNSIEISTYTTILGFGKPQRIFLQWKNLEKVTFESSGGTPHPGSRDTAGSQVIFTQIVIAQLD